MAVLETIRQKKKILAIVIGLGLFAFIAEVAVEVIGRTGNPSDAARVGSEKIDFATFQHRVEKVSAADQNNPQARDIDAATRNQQVLEEMIDEQLLDNEFDKVGIYVSDNEITELMVGQNPAQQVVQFAQQVGSQFGIQTPAEFYDFMTNPQNPIRKETGIQDEQFREVRAEWENMQDEIVRQYKGMKLQTLVAGALQPNKLDIAAMEEDEATTCYINYVKKELASLPDDKFPVSDAEMKAEWEKHKATYKIDSENRMIHYIAVPVTPSQADIAQANAAAEKAMRALQFAGLDSVRVLGSSVQWDTVMAPIDKITPKVAKDFASAAAIGAVTRDTTAGPGNNVMYKLLNKTMSLDSVQVSMAIIPGGKATQDSALAMLNAGKTIDEVAKAIKGAQGQNDMWQQIATQPDSIKEKFVKADGVYTVWQSTDQGAYLLKVTDKRPAKMFYTVATVKCEAFASSKTNDNLRAKLQDYVNKNKNIEAFTANAAKAGYNAVAAIIDGNMPQLGMNPYTGQGIKDTRKAIKWAFDAKKGMISPIFGENKDMLVVVCVDDIYNDYIPYNSPYIKEQLERKVRNEKKAESLMAQYKGKATDLAGFAQLMGAQIDTTQVTFGSDMIAKIGSEPVLLGRVMGSKDNQVVGPVKGETGVYAFTITKREATQRKMTKEEATQRYSQRMVGPLMQNVFQILSKATKVERNLIKFY